MTEPTVIVTIGPTFTGEPYLRLVIGSEPGSHSNARQLANDVADLLKVHFAAMGCAAILMECLETRCWSPVACKAFGYCRIKNFSFRDEVRENVDVHGADSRTRNLGLPRHENTEEDDPKGVL